jgi:hypothetical protein
MSTPSENKGTLLPVKFVTEKDQSFRTYHADGAWAMVNNFGNIQLNFFVEHVPLAKSITYQLDQAGHPADEGTVDVQQEEGRFFGGSRISIGGRLIRGFSQAGPCYTRKFHKNGRRDVCNQ